MSARPLRLIVAEPAAAGSLHEAFALDAGMEIVGAAHDGVQAVELTHKLRPDAVVIDVLLTRMNGLEATRRIMSEIPTPVVIVAEDLGRASVQLSMEALRAGALAAVEKPVSPGSAKFPVYSAALIDAVRTMADVKLVRRWRNRPAPAPLPEPPLKRAALKVSAIPSVVAIGASTGGPAALYSILTSLRAPFPQPIVITQHISPGFVRGMVSWLDEAARVKVKLAQHGEMLRANTAYIADDERHLTVLADRTIALVDGPIVDGHRPSATVLFQSVARAYGPRGMGVILTGMGRDGVDGLQAIHRAGGAVLAQDEKSCAVFGMPKAAIEAGLADAVLPLEVIAEELNALTEFPEDSRCKRS